MSGGGGGILGGDGPIGQAIQVGADVITAGGTYVAREELVKKPKKKAEQAINDQAYRQQKAVSELEATQKAQEDQAMAIEAGTNEQVNARKNQKNKRAASGGRRGTILTSPLGVTEDPNVPQKTLLGN